MNKYRIILKSNGKFEAQFFKSGLFGGWRRFIMAQQGSMIIPLEFNTEAEAKCFILNKASGKERVVIEFEA